MVKFIAGIAVGIAFMSLIATNDGKAIKDKLFKFVNEATNNDDTIIDITPDKQE